MYVYVCVCIYLYIYIYICIHIWAKREEHTHTHNKYSKCKKHSYINVGQGKQIKKMPTTSTRRNTKRHAVKQAQHISKYTTCERRTRQANQLDHMNL